MKRFLIHTLHVIRNVITWVSILTALIWTLIFFVPKLFGYYPFVVLSGSMEPVVHVGSLAYVEMSDEGEEPVPDGIYAYRTKDGEMVLHRMVGTSDTGYVFKGDANNTYDAATVNDNDIAGRYVLSIPYMGYVGAWVSNYSIGIGIVKIPAAVLMMAGAILISNVLCGIADNDDECNERGAGLNN